MLSLAVAIIWLCRVRLARSMENRADKIARESTEEMTIYARALERIYCANQVPAVMRKSTLLAHPSLYDRMIAANLTPDYPRPTPPSTQGWTSIVATIPCTIMVLYLFEVFR